MAVSELRDEGQKPGYPREKVFGIVNVQDELDRLSHALGRAGFHEIEAIRGDEGIALFERMGRGLRTLFFADVEERLFNRYTHKLRAGHIVVAISAPPDRAENVVRIAFENGVDGLMYFGPWAVTLYPPPPRE